MDVYDANSDLYGRFHPLPTVVDKCSYDDDNTLAYERDVYTLLRICERPQWSTWKTSDRRRTRWGLIRPWWPPTLDGSIPPLGTFWLLYFLSVASGAAALIPL
ncbi:hypothetical protein LZ30DRAFT_694008 [Colletotrichum cereale]|nr:hypothetical protein LZ30DRAFT_694008 [Colletotrichum cereale]